MNRVASQLLRVVHLSYTGRHIHQRTSQLWRVVVSQDIYRFARLAVFIILDMLLGLCLAHLLRRLFVTPQRSIDFALEGADLVVHGLRRLITWLMGAPAGLKLNSVLSHSLGKFFLYHIHLWRTFLHVITPYVSHCLHMGLKWSWSSSVGFCIQLSFAQDVFNVITFHVHCFYAYARRIFVSQSSALMSLWRLFRGKKYNPLRNRVDSSSHENVEQLFVGTLAFTILLFLYPTTLVYYAVFAVLESCLTVTNFLVNWLVEKTTLMAEFEDEDLNGKDGYFKGCWKKDM